MVIILNLLVSDVISMSLMLSLVILICQYQCQHSFHLGFFFWMRESLLLSHIFPLQKKRSKMNNNVLLFIFNFIFEIIDFFLLITFLIILGFYSIVINLDFLLNWQCESYCKLNNSPKNMSELFTSRKWIFNFSIFLNFYLFIIFWYYCKLLFYLLLDMGTFINSPNFKL